MDFRPEANKRTYTTEEFVSSLAREIVRRRLETPALILLESLRPVASVARSAGLFEVFEIGKFEKLQSWVGGVREVFSNPELLNSLVIEIEKIASQGRQQ